MKTIAISFIISSLWATNVMAQDRYQMVPIWAAYSSNTFEDRHAAYRIDMETGDVYYCIAVFLASQVNGGPRIENLSCSNTVTKTGKIPSGPATFSEYISGAKGGAYMAFWKVNQANGVVTFCADVEPGQLSPPVGIVQTLSTEFASPASLGQSK